MNRSGAYYPVVPDDRDRLIRDHLPLVGFLVDRMTTQVPSYLSREDIASAAMIGLADAANRFDPGRGILFKTFAEPRIRGAILDEARRTDWFSRTLREKQARLCATIDQLEKSLGRSPAEEETAAALGIPLEKYRQMLNEVGHLGCISLHETIDDSEEGRTLLDCLESRNCPSPLEVLEASDLTREIADHLQSLSEKERHVIALYYYEELTQKEIAEVLEVSEGRISQLHSQALAKLKVRLSRSRKRQGLPPR